MAQISCYSVKDLIKYIKTKGWKTWQGYGIHMYVGLFGHGKTLSAVRFVTQNAKKYNLHVLSNIQLFDVEYEPLVNYQQIIDAPANTIILIDEVSTLFNARSWKDFNMTLLFQLLQCRKQRKQLVCTAQRFAHVDKLLRDITSYVIVCNKTWRLQHNEYYDAWDYDNANNSSLISRLNNVWWFVPDNAFNSYDTSELIDNAKKTAFISNEEILDKQAPSDTALTNVQNASRKLKKLVKGSK